MSAAVVIDQGETITGGVLVLLRRCAVVSRSSAAGLRSWPRFSHQVLARNLSCRCLAAQEPPAPRHATHPALMSSAAGTISDMTDTAPAPSTVDKAHQASSDEVRGMVVSSPVMPQVVEGPLKLPPLTAPTPPAVAPPPKNGSDG